MKIPKGMRMVPELTRELENFNVKINTLTAHGSYEAWRESDHDNLCTGAWAGVLVGREALRDARGG